MSLVVWLTPRVFTDGGVLPLLVLVAEGDTAKEVSFTAVGGWIGGSRNSLLGYFRDVY